MVSDEVDAKTGQPSREARRVRAVGEIRIRREVDANKTLAAAANAEVSLGIHTHSTRHPRRFVVHARKVGDIGTVVIPGHGKRKGPGAGRAGKRQMKNQSTKGETPKTHESPFGFFGETQMKQKGSNKKGMALLPKSQKAGSHRNRHNTGNHQYFTVFFLIKPAQTFHAAAQWGLES